ncbi:MAG: TRAP transporter substrate-binding protein [Hyphomicrobiales bacterium]
MTFNFRRLGLSALVGSALGLASFGALAQEVNLRVHHFLSDKHNTHAKVLAPWAEKIEKESDGRIKMTIFPRMQLGGKPPQLMDQVRDGVADVVWTLPGYTAGRYPRIAAFELPFMVSNAEATSQALQEYYEKHAKEEFADVKPLWFHTHARGVIHTREKQIKTAADFDGMKLRAPNRGIGTAMEAMGAASVFMPVPALPEALSKGVVDGAVIPWEIVPPLKVQDLAPNHTETPGERGLYTAVFVIAMNKAKYDALPDDLKKIIDDNSGLALAKSTGKIWDDSEATGLKVVNDKGNPIHQMADSEVAIMKEKTRPVIDKWIADLGDDGQALYDDANALLDKYSN